MNQHALCILGEIDVRLAKVMSRAHTQQHTMSFCTARHKVQDTSQDLQSSNNVLMPVSSDCVASLIGYPLIEVREKTFRRQSHKLQTTSPTACDAVTEIVDSVFDACLIA